LDRLERDGLVEHTVSERDRRVRISQATPTGIKVVQQVGIARDAAINDRLAAIPAADRATFYAALWAIVASTEPSTR
jgi:DNA-binding MarR family transcriptional regulator